MHSEKTRRPVKASLMLMLATSVWGATFLATKALGQIQQRAIPEAGTWFVAALSLLLRFGIAAMFIGLWNRRRLQETTRLELWQGIGLGVFGGLGILFQTDGVQHTAASTSAFLTQCYCIFIPLALAWHRRKMPVTSLIVSCVLVMGGVGVLANIDWKVFRIGRGEAESILGSLLFTGQILWLERSVFQPNRNGVTTFIMFTTVALVVFPVVLMTGSGPAEWAAAYNSWPAIALIGYLTLGGTLAAYVLMIHWQPHLPATQAGLVYCCEPLFTSIFALFLPGCLSAAMLIHYANETVTARLLVGGGLISAANLLALWPNLRPSPLPPATNRAG